MDRRNWLQRTLGSIGAAFTAPAIAAESEWEDGATSLGYAQTPNAFYTPDPDATAHLGMYTSDPGKFAINRYADMVFDPVTANSRIPGSKRYCFPFEVPWQKHPVETAEHAAIPAANAMIIRMLSVVHTLVHPRRKKLISETDPRYAPWRLGSRPEKDEWIANLKWCLLYGDKNPDDFRLVMNQTTFEKYQKLTKFPNAFIETADGWVWNGVRVVVESCVKSERAWPDGMILLVYCSKTEAERRKSTIRFKFTERMTVETKPDRDNNCYVGRVIEDYAIEINPEFGFLVMGA